MVNLIVATGLILTTVDGDTFKTDLGDRVRLLNIDAPEMGSRARCEYERELAAAAKARSQEFLESAGQATLITDGYRDRYGRLLAHIEIDGRDLGAVMISEGLAQPWTGRRAEWCD